MTAQVPSVGRAVHYVSYGSPFGKDGNQRYPSKCRAAVITDVNIGDPDDEVIVSLMVLNPTGIFFDEEVRQDEDHKTGGTWHWPERV